MMIKTFEAPTMQEALALAKGEFGENAVVLNTKHMKTGGLLGLGGSDKVELMAAADESGESPGVRESGSPPFDRVIHDPVGVSRTSMSASPGVSAGPASPMGSLAAMLYSEARNVAPEPGMELTQLRAEVRELSNIVQTILSGRSDAPKLGEPLLLRLGIDEDIARNLMSDLLTIDDPASLASALAAKMQAFAMPTLLDTPKVIAVVGPTGVGKTTTLAKLAAKYSLEQGKSVALVTADTYRIGAVEQLRTYARIMGVPLEIALSTDEVAAGVAKHRDKDVVLIDTVGRSQRSDEHMAELKSFVDAAQPTETHLVVAASLSGEIQREVVERFSVLSPTRLIITKLDESPNRGCLVNLPLRTGLGISCTTAGQNVPQDIDFADAGNVARAITGVA